METAQQISNTKVEYKSYGYLLDKRAIPYREDGAWFVHGKPDHDNRWIVCVSISMKYTEQILDAVLPYVKEHGYSFALIKNQLQHNQINNNVFPVTFFGKALIIYPESIGLCAMAAKDLAEMTNRFAGVYIPGCIRMGSIIYIAFSKPNPDFKGDENSVPFLLENIPHADELFPESLKWKEKRISRFIKNRYLPISSINSSYKGNILKGFDFYRMRWVFIKQARPWATEDIYGRQMRDRLLWQKKVSEDLEGKMSLPKVLDYVEQDGYYYLITQYIAGVSLDTLLKDRSNSLGKLLPYYVKAAEEVQKMHELKYVHRDITSKNIIIRKRDKKVFLTDFELSYPLVDSVMMAFESGTKGYMSPQQTRNERPTDRDDIYSLGALLYYLASRNHPRCLTETSFADKADLIKNLKVPEKLKDAMGRCLGFDTHTFNITQLVSTITELVNKVAL